jgi:hypothetical protein
MFPLEKHHVIRELLTGRSYWRAAVRYTRPSWYTLPSGGSLIPEKLNIVVEPIRLDFPDLLAWADGSISQAGYNTAMDISNLWSAGSHGALLRLRSGRAISLGCASDKDGSDRPVAGSKCL